MNVILTQWQKCSQVQMLAARVKSEQFRPSAFFLSMLSMLTLSVSIFAALLMLVK